MSLRLFLIYCSITYVLTYQLAFLTPGIRPCQANSRKQMRQSLNLLKYPPDLPQIGHRVYLRVENLGTLFHLAICELLAIIFTY